jgi:hypothetical protein
MTVKENFTKQIENNIDSYNLTIARRENKKRNKNFTPVIGYYYWLTTKNTQPNGPKKLGPRYTGPYKAIATPTPVSVTLDLGPTNNRRQATFHVKDLKIFYNPDF